MKKRDSSKLIFVSSIILFVLFLYFGFEFIGVIKHSSFASDLFILFPLPFIFWVWSIVELSRLDIKQDKKRKFRLIFSIVSNSLIYILPILFIIIIFLSLDGPLF